MRQDLANSSWFRGPAGDIKRPEAWLELRREFERY
jgi:hypothetical protein